MAAGHNLPQMLRLALSQMISLAEKYEILLGNWTLQLGGDMMFLRPANLINYTTTVMGKLWLGILCL